MNKDTPIAMPPDIAEENARRLAKINAPYHPLTGDSNDPARVPYEFNGTRYHLPRSMTESRQLAKVAGQRDFNMLRFKYDFEYWAAACVRITDKITGADVPFILNRPQRRLARVLERRPRSRCASSCSKPASGAARPWCKYTSHGYR